MDGIKFSGREMFRHLNLASLTSWYEFKPGRGASPLTTMPGESRGIGLELARARTITRAFCTITGLPISSNQCKPRASLLLRKEK